MQIGRYQINLDALAARLVCRWPVPSLAIIILLIALGGFGSGLIPPFRKGRAALQVSRSGWR
jgi:hypothetical protein